MLGPLFFNNKNCEKLKMIADINEMYTIFYTIIHRLIVFISTYGGIYGIYDEQSRKQNTRTGDKFKPGQNNVVEDAWRQCGKTWETHCMLYVTETAASEKTNRCLNPLVWYKNTARCIKVKNL